jgi:hypothetical protein
MGRYVSRHRTPERSYEEDWWDKGPLVPHLTTDDSVAVNTGLLDAGGNAIWRTPNPIGFGRDEEWG